MGLYLGFSLGFGVIQVYLVGGAVRDLLLGQPLQDRDFVVVGSTPAQMTNWGFIPVGQDFPVFLHPKTHEQYALARTERKTGHGYHGFTFFTDPSVTLAQDLARRDLTINAMALPCPNMPVQEGFQDWLPLSNQPASYLPASLPTLIDPHGGQGDLQNACLRHISPAFSEDPVRVLRVARFAARFPQFRIHPDTWVLMHHMVAQGETQSLVYERVWQETARALMATSPSRFFEVLNRIQPLGPEWPALIPPWVLTQLDQAAHGGCPLPVRVALLAQSWPEPSLFQTHAHILRMPRSAIQLSTLWLRERTPLKQALTFSAADWASFFERCDAWRQNQRFEELREVWSLSQPDLYASVRLVLEAAWQAASTVNPGAVVAGLTQQKIPQGSQGTVIAQAIRQARQQAIQKALSLSTFLATPLDRTLDI